MAMIEGFLPIYKPPGMSTFDVIRTFKRETGYKGKVGHGGTLDLFACGIVVVLLGKATKEFDQLQNSDKEYVAGVRLGYFANTLDAEGVFARTPYKAPKWEDIRKASEEFVGEIEQRVPSFSAAKQEGVPLYKLARQGKVIEEKSKKVSVYEVELVAYRNPLATLRIRCSSGTYIRQLTNDIFAKLQTGSFLFYLERTRVGGFFAENAVRLQDLKSGSWEKAVVAELTV